MIIVRKIVLIIKNSNGGNVNCDKNNISNNKGHNNNNSNNEEIKTIVTVVIVMKINYNSKSKKK